MRRQTIEKVLDRICYIHINEKEFENRLSLLSVNANEATYHLTNAIDCLDLENSIGDAWTTEDETIHITKDLFAHIAQSLKDADRALDELHDKIDALKGL